MPSDTFTAMRTTRRTSAAAQEWNAARLLLLAEHGSPHDAASQHTIASAPSPVEPLGGIVREAM